MNQAPAPDPPPAGGIARILVSLDAAADNGSALDIAARLAAGTKAPLHGVFVEDEDLLNFAALPFARHVTLGAGVQRFTREAAELHLKAAAKRARDQLLAAARRHRVKASFEIVRGGATHVLSAASDRDLVVAGALTRPIAGHFRLEAGWWSAIDAAPGPLLLLRHEQGGQGAVMVLLRDRGAASARLLEAAAGVAEAREAPLTVICPPELAGADGFARWIADRVGGHHVPVHIEIASAEPGCLQQRLVELDCRLLAVEAGLVEGGGERLREVVGGCSCDLLVVR